MKNSKLDRYIKNSSGVKTELHVTSVNITEKQREFLEKNNLNLSKITRERLDELMKGS